VFVAVDDDDVVTDANGCDDESGGAVREDGGGGERDGREGGCGEARREICKSSMEMNQRCVSAACLNRFEIKPEPSWSRNSA
jgi:hypothetical protein